MDGTMCEGTACPMRESCYRYNAEPNPYRQSYFMEVPLKWLESSHDKAIRSDTSTDVASCEEYWEYPKKEKK